MVILPAPPSSRSITHSISQFHPGRSAAAAHAMLVTSASRASSGLREGSDSPSPRIMPAKWMRCAAAACATNRASSLEGGLGEAEQAASMAAAVTRRIDRNILFVSYQGCGFRLSLRVAGPKLRPDGDRCHAGSMDSQPPTAFAWAAPAMLAGGGVGVAGAMVVGALDWTLWTAAAVALLALAAAQGGRLVTAMPLRLGWSLIEPATLGALAVAISFGVPVQRQIAVGKAAVIADAQLIDVLVQRVSRAECAEAAADLQRWHPRSLLGARRKAGLLMHTSAIGGCIPADQFASDLALLAVLARTEAGRARAIPGYDLAVWLEIRRLDKSASSDSSLSEAAEVFAASMEAWCTVAGNPGCMPAEPTRAPTAEPAISI